jgi:asparagine synthetase B (glutamine-hydrolysing)
MIYSNLHITSPIVPSTTQYYTLPGNSTLDYKAVCCFAATGFFLDDETYFVNQKAFRPATSYLFDKEGNVAKKERYFQWHYSPRTISFAQALEEFEHLLESIVQRNIFSKKVVLPISGGLDSRVLAASVSNHPHVVTYSYQFEGGSLENDYGEAVAKALSFPHQSFLIPSGYLWGVIKELAQINSCYAEFLNPRQMAIWQQMSDKGDIFLLGHGGDLFFDSMGVPDGMSDADQKEYLVKKLVKPVGWTLGEQLWKAWGLTGDFKEYLIQRIGSLLNNIQIENANARLRAFKTEYYVARWTAVNLEIFQRQLPIGLPFFDDDMCRFICTIPEEYLAGRKLEIEYLKRKSKSLALIPWQKYFPCNLYDYTDFDSLLNKYRRGLIKGRREVRKYLFGKRSDAGNWELQFLGKSNDESLRRHLFDKSFEQLVPVSVIENFYTQFKQNPSQYTHSTTMLLTLSLFSQLFLKTARDE